MNILLSERSASCVVECPWEAPGVRQKKVARIELVTRPQKRKLGKSKRSCKGVVVRAAIWSAPERWTKSSKTCTGQVVSECMLPGHNGSARLLCVDVAEDSMTYCRFTWIAVALSTGQGTNHGVALLRLTNDGIEMYHLFALQEAVVQAIVLGGPCVMYRTASKLAMVIRGGEVPFFDTDGNSVVFENTVSAVFSSSGVDGAIVYGKESTTVTTKHRSIVCVIQNDGHCTTLAEWDTEDGVTPEQMCYSPLFGVLILIAKDGGVAALNSSSGELLWQTKAINELRCPLDCVMLGDRVLLTGSDSESVWVLPISSKNRGAHSHVPEVLFRNDCSVSTSQDHCHFFAPWRKSMLQCNGINGAHCWEEPFEDDEAYANPKNCKDTFMDNIMQNLEKRLSVGIERVTDAAERRKEKNAMLEHAREVLTVVAEKQTVPVNRIFFRHPLNTIVSLADNNHHSPPQSSPGSSAEEDDKKVNQRKISVCGRESLANSGRFAKLLESRCVVDDRGDFILVRVKIEMSTQGGAEGLCAASTTVRLDVQFNASTAAVWDVEQKSAIMEGDTVELRGCAPVHSLVSSEVNRGLEDMNISLRVITTDGRAQCLVSFTLADVFAQDLHQTSRKDGGNCLNGGYLGFGREVTVIAQGPSAHKLQSLTHVNSIGRQFFVRCRENLAHIMFTVTSASELAMALGKMYALADDGVHFRSSSQRLSTSLRLIDTSLRALESEMQLHRDVSGQSVGLPQSDATIKKIFESQISVDDLFGRLEEYYMRI